MAEYKILVAPPKSPRRPWLIAMAIVLVVVVAVGAAAYLVGRHSTSGPGAQNQAGNGAATVPPTTLRVLSTTPARGATNVPSDQVVSVHLSLPVADTAGMPDFSPPVSGSWKKVGSSTLSFVATAPFIPTTTETLTIPAGSAGPHSTGGVALKAPVSLNFTVAQASTERLQQLLAELNYLPLSFTPSGPAGAPNKAISAQPGTFAWRWPSLPTTLTSLWTEGSENVITKAAVMNFENQNGLGVDGIAGMQVWSTLLADVAHNKVDANTYDYVLVSKQAPENLYVIANGIPALVNIPVNTGAPGADTADGTYPVFEHVTSSRMKGTNPDGTTYDDPDVPWASYFNGGDALHGFVRATYGSPQSNGCVEMALPNAAKVWTLTPIGTLVTVTGPPS